MLIGSTNIFILRVYSNSPDLDQRVGIAIIVKFCRKLHDLVIVGPVETNGEMSVQYNPRDFSNGGVVAPLRFSFFYSFFFSVCV